MAYRDLKRLPSMCILDSGPFAGRGEAAQEDFPGSPSFPPTARGLSYGPGFFPHNLECPVELLLSR
jgi:hypothetical protein